MSARCDCIPGSSRCAEADGYWAAANAVYYAQGYDAWQKALEPYNAHMAALDRPPLRADTPVVIVAGKHRNEPAVVAKVQRRYAARTVEVLLGRTGERVTVRTSSLEVYG